MSDREERIRMRAHQIWERAGRPFGEDERHWEQASREIDEEDASGASGGSDVGASGTGAQPPGGATGPLKPGKPRP